MSHKHRSVDEVLPRQGGTVRPALQPGDIVYGGDGDDTILGADGAQLINGGNGQDSITAGEGDDSIAFEWNRGGNDFIDGGEGIDVLNLSFKRSSAPVRIDLEKIRFFGVDEAPEIYSVERIGLIVGSNAGDRFEGSAGQDSMWGGAGADQIDGKRAQDVVFGGAGEDRVFGGVGDDLADGGEGADRLEGNSGKDLLRGDDADDWLDGGGDNDILLGDAGRDILLGGSGEDSLKGGEGKDLLSGGLGDDAFLADGLDRVLGGPGDDFFAWNPADSKQMAQISGGSGFDIAVLDGLHMTSDLHLKMDRPFPGIEENLLLCGDGDDLIRISRASAVVDGGYGDDTIIAGAGNDKIAVGWGANLAIGGEGSDLLGVEFGNSEKLSSRIKELLGKFGQAEGRTEAAEIESESWNKKRGSYISSAAQHFVTGSVFLNSGTGTLGWTSLFGGNTYSGASNLTLGSGSIRSENGWTLTNGSIQPLNPTPLVIPAFTNRWEGGVGNDTILGGEFSGYLDGGSGADLLVGGTLSDIFIVDDPEDVIKNEGGVYDLVYSSLSRFTMPEAIENLILTKGAQFGFGNANANQIVGNLSQNLLKGGTGSDSLDGGGGLDRMIGGEESDFYVVDRTGDQVVESEGEGLADTVESKAFSYKLPANVEFLRLIGDAKEGSGNGGDNKIYGNAESNRLSGGPSSDWVNGGDGDDTLIGAVRNDAQFDFLTGGAGKDLFVLGDEKGTFYENADDAALVLDFGQGVDQLQLSGGVSDYTSGASQFFSFPNFQSPGATLSIMGAPIYEAANGNLVAVLALFTGNPLANAEFV